MMLVTVISACERTVATVGTGASMLSIVNTFMACQAFGPPFSRKGFAASLDWASYWDVS